MQDWKYGEPHAIYEYTHPHLAKYLIALGLETFGSPRVDARTTYPTTISAIAARPEDALSAGRMWIAGPRDISVIDAATRAVIGTIPLRNVAYLTASSDGSLWGATATGAIFTADRATADQGGTSGLSTWLTTGGANAWHRSARGRHCRAGATRPAPDHARRSSCDQHTTSCAEPPYSLSPLMAKSESL